MKYNTTFIQAVATLSGAVIGAGILAIPYTVYIAGYWTGVLYLSILGIMMIVLHLMLGEISLRTKGFAPLSKLLKIYIGKKGELLGIGATFIIIYGALTAYIEASGEILHSFFPASPILWSIVFTLIGTSIALKGVRIVSQWQLLFLIGMILIIVSIALRAVSDTMIDWNQFVISPSNSIRDIITPYGPILFAYSGLLIIPQIKQIIQKDKTSMKSSIILAGLIPILLYALFVTVVIGVVGSDIGPIASIELGAKMGPQISAIINIFALLAMLTSFIALTIASVDTYRSFSQIHPITANFITVFPSLVFVYLNSHIFNLVLGVAGALGVGILSILTVLMFWRAKRTGKVSPGYSLGEMKWTGISIMTILGLGVLSLLFEIFN
jgi:amino acid permease